MTEPEAGTLAQGGGASRRLPELARLFLKLGTVSFGGPAAHTAMMEDEVVRRRGWLTRERFLDLVGATNLIPGPNSTELAIHVGALRAGAPGLVVAGVCFILPAVVIVAVLAWAYVRLGTLPSAAGFLAGVQPVVIAIVLQALWRLGRTALKTRALAALGAVATLSALGGAHELAVLFGAGAAWVVGRRLMRRDPASGTMGVVTLATLGGAGPAAVAAGAAFNPGLLFLVFLKIGSVLFGSGYVLLAFLRADVVERLGWLTESQLFDAIAVGQVTPGPLFTTATFIGYVVGGPSGAVLATAGIFLPAFVFVALSAPLLPKLRGSSDTAAFLDAVNVASLALMTVVTWRLGAHALQSVSSVAIGLGALALLRLGVNSAWLVVGGGLFGLLLARYG